MSDADYIADLQMTIGMQRNEIARLEEIYRRERAAHAANLKEWKKCEAKCRKLMDRVDILHAALMGNSNVNPPQPPGPKPTPPNPPPRKP